MTVPTRVTVRTVARLHMGVLDLGGRLGRRFGGIGAAIPQPAAVVEAVPATDWSAEGPEAERVLQFARAVAEKLPAVRPARFLVHEVMPAHAGLGSGTQLGLAVARAIAALNGLDLDTGSLARAVGRGVRSAIGTWAFESGGFLVEGGRRPGAASVAPLLARFTMPAAWRCVVVIPDGRRGLSGEAELAALRSLPAPPDREVEQVSHLVLMQLLPALVEGDLSGFGGALTGIQRITGGWFARSQGGVYAPGPTAELVELLSELGAPGVGQSSWGPTVYGIVDSDGAAERIARAAERALAGAGTVLVVPFSARGASVIVDGA